MSKEHAQDLIDKLFYKDKSIGEIWECLHQLGRDNYTSAELFRMKARRAYKKENKGAWKKFTSLARVYERQGRRLSIIACALQGEVPEKFLSGRVPF